MNTLTVLSRVRREMIAAHGYPMLSENALLMRTIVVGICHERFHSSITHLSALTAETPEEITNLLARWRKWPSEHQDKWRRLFVE